MHHSVNKSYYGCFYGWARFMSTGYFVLGKYREMEWMCRSQSRTAALSV